MNVPGASDFGLRQVSAGLWAVDMTNTTNKYARLIDVDPTGYAGYPNTTATAAGTVINPVVYFEFIASICQFGGAR
jgi:hypothetical protein